MKKIIHYTCQFQGTIVVDIPDDQVADFDAQDHLYYMTNEELVAGCETNMAPELDLVEDLEEETAE